MNSAKIIGILLIVGGVLGLVFGGVSFTKETEKASLGPISLTVQEKETINVPLWASILAIGAGVGVMLIGLKKS